MSIELEEIVAMLQDEKARYDQLIAHSMDALGKLLTKRETSLTSEDKHEWDGTIDQFEQEIRMLHSLYNYIDFKLKILSIKNHAS